MTDKAPSLAELTAFANRIDDVTSAIEEVLNEDPAAALAQREARAEKRREESERMEKARLEKVKMRYEPKFFSRFERDDLIDALLKEADEEDARRASRGGRVCVAPGSAPMDLSLYSKAERLCVEEAQKHKDDGAKAVQRADWPQALHHYSAAIKLLAGMEDEPIGQLLAILHNNRALVHNKLGMFLDAIEDASFVLGCDMNNIKALLRRATALRKLHRPVEALKDVDAVLRREPRNAEALQQRQWLELAERELAACERFVEAEQQRSEGGAAATLSAAAAALKVSSATAQADASGREGVAASSAELAAGQTDWQGAVKALLNLTGVVEGHGLGAAVLLAVRGGVPVVVQWIVSTLQVVMVAEREGKGDNVENRAPRAVLVQSLSLLTTVLELSEVALQELSERVVEDLSARLVDALDLRLAGRPCIALDTALLLCLGRLVKCYPGAVGSALGKTPTPDLLTRILEHAVTVASPLLLLAYMEFLDALMDSTASMGGADAKKLGALLFAPGTVLTETQPPPPLLLAVAEKAFSSAFACMGTAAAAAIRLKGLQYTLRLTCYAASAACEVATHRSAIHAFVCSSTFTRALYAATVVALGATPAPSTAELEALYALLHNLILIAPDRQEYLREGWLSADLTPSLFTLTLNFILAQSDAFLLTPACGNMIGTLPKLYTGVSDPAVITSTVDQLSKAEPKLWAWLAAVAAEATRQRLASGAREGTAAVAVDATLVSLAEHLLSILAFLSVQRGGAAAGQPYVTATGGADSSLAKAIDILFGVMSLGVCFTEGSVMAAAEGGRPVPPVAPLVLLASNALLLSSIVTPYAGNNVCYKELMRHKAVDILIGKLREVRTSLLMLRSEAAKGEHASIKDTLAEWVKLTAQTQQNLCIAIGKVCAVQGKDEGNEQSTGESLMDRLRLLNGIELLAAAFRK